MGLKRVTQEPLRAHVLKAQVQVENKYRCLNEFHSKTSIK